LKSVIKNQKLFDYKMNLKTKQLKQLKKLWLFQTTKKKTYLN